MWSSGSILGITVVVTGLAGWLPRPTAVFKCQGPGGDPLAAIDGELSDLGMEALAGGELDLPPVAGSVSLRLEATPEGWTGTAGLARLFMTCYVFDGAAAPPTAGLTPRVPQCVPTREPMTAQRLPANPEADFRALEEALLSPRVVRMDFHVTATGAAEIEVRGSLSVDAQGEIELTAQGEFGGQPVDLALQTSGEEYEFGNGPDRVREPRPPELRQALILGLTRMGILHNLARLTGNAAPDHADGGADDWVQAHGFDQGETPGSVAFELTVAGQSSGSAELQFDAQGRPVIRHQTVNFPTGVMNVVERYENVVIRRD